MTEARRPDQALIAAARLGLEALQQDLRLTLESHCILDRVSLDPRQDTLDEIAKPIVEDLRAKIAQVTAAISDAEGRAHG